MAELVHIYVSNQFYSLDLSLYLYVALLGWGISYI